MPNLKHTSGWLKFEADIKTRRSVQTYTFWKPDAVSAAAYAERCAADLRDATDTFHAVAEVRMVS